MDLVWIVPGFQSDASDRCIPALTDLAHAVAAKHSLTVYALQYPGREDDYTVGRVRVRAFKAGPPNLPQVRRVAPLYRAIRAISRQKFDVLHAFWAAEPALVGVIAKNLTKRPLIISCMGGEPANLPEIGYGAGQHPLDRLYLRLAVHGATVLTCGSSAQAKLVAALFPGKVMPRICPLGIDTNRFAFTEQPPTQLAKKQLLAVGSLVPVKGHVNLLKAMAIVRQKEPDCCLKIVGEGVERPRLARLISDLNLMETVKLAGASTADKMPDEYAMADLFVLASYYESQCVALGEALACGLPAIAPPVGYAPELLGDGKAGQLAASNAPADLAEAILAMLAKIEQWPTMHRAARQRAESVNLENCTRSFLKLYEEIESQRSTEIFNHRGTETQRSTPH